MLSEPSSPEAPVLRERDLAIALGMTITAGAIAGTVGGVVVGGVLGRLAMRLLAVTSPPAAQGRITDDNAIVGRITLEGSFDLAVFTTLAGVIGGLVYLLCRRILPEDRRGRVLGFGILCGALGGAFFVHDHPSFDFTVLTPAWLAVALFVALPLLFGVVIVMLVERLDGPTGWLRRAPTPLVLGVGGLVTLPTVPFTGLVILAAFAVALVPRLRVVWRSRAVTVAGSILYVLLVLWGLYGLGADIMSIATDSPSTAPFNP
jgi:hypothetical protein